eukprot:gene13581-16059_t
MAMVSSSTKACSDRLFSGSLPIPAPGLRLSLVLLALAAAVLCCVDIAGEVAQRAAEEEEWAQSLIGFTVPWYQHHSWGRGGTDGADSEEETLQLNMEDGIADAELLSYAQELGLSEEQVQEQLHPSNELAQANRKVITGGKYGYTREEAAQVVTPRMLWEREMAKAKR